MTIVGIDLSLRAPGIAAPNQVWTEKRFAKFTGSRRLCAYRDFFDGMLRGYADLVILEGYSHNSKFGGEALGELGGVMRLLLLDLGIPHAVVPPASLKKYATGKGNAGKDAVLSAAVHRSGVEFEDNNSADAWWLRQMGLAHFVPSSAVPMPATHVAALDAVDWPLVDVGRIA